MKHGILTLYEGNYHLGVGALINSAVHSGFEGTFLVGYRDAPPPWLAQLERVREGVYAVGGCELECFRCDPGRHLTYHKPFAALELLEARAELDTIFYADPDVLFLAPWAYFEKWVGCGVTLCLDANFPFVGRHHPWRKDWGGIIDRAQLKTVNTTTRYYNAGFFGLRRKDIGLLKNWAILTERFEEEGGSTAAMDTANFVVSVRSDQELLAAAAMTFEDISEIGQEGMGFNGHYCILSHAVESPKPWVQNNLRTALAGRGVSVACSLFWDYCEHPILIRSPRALRIKKLSVKLAKLLSRFYRRPT